MATEIGTLIAKFIADTTNFDKGIKKVEGGMRGTAEQAQMLGNAFNNALSRVSPTLGQLSTSLTGVTTGMGGMAAAAGLVTAGVGALAAGAIAAGAAIYSLTTNVAEATGKFKDLSQQTGFSVETLSALANAAETTGGSIEGVTSSLFLFETKMGEAKDASSETAKIFKALNIDTTDHEKALRQALEALTLMTNAEDRATVGKKLFGRSVKDLLGALAEAGTLDKFLNDQLEKGYLVTGKMADAGDELSDAVIIMGRAFESVRRIVADEFGPDVLAAVQKITKAIEDNRPLIREWINSFYQAAAGASRLVGWVEVLSGSLLSLANIPIPRAIKWLYDIGAFGGALGGLDLLAPAQSAATGPMTSGLIGGGAPSLFDLGGQQGGKQYRGFGPTQNRPKVNLDFLGGTPGGGGGGGAAKAKAEIDPVIQLIKQLTDEMRRLTEQTRVEEVAQQLLGEEFKNTTQAAKDQAMALAAVMDEHKKLVKIIEGMEKAFDNATDAIKELGTTATDVLETRMGQLLPGILENLPHGTGVTRGGRNELPNVIGEAGPWEREEQADNEAIEYYEKIKRQMDRLAFELTDSIDKAVYDGFEGGIKRGFASLALSILDMIRNTFLLELQKSIASALTNATSVGGGQKGGWLAAIAGFAIKVLGGSVGAGIGGGGQVGSAAGALMKGMQHGGPVSAGTPYIVGERGPELFMPNSSGNIIPNGGGNTVININVPVRSAGSYSTPKSRRQLAEDIAGALAGATS